LNATSLAWWYHFAMTLLASKGTVPHGLVA
jgi:hypothetical protein